MFIFYEKYLDQIGAKIDKFFKQAAPYIFCKEGCSHCCEIGQYPFSELEFKYILLGALNLSAEEIKIIDENVAAIKKEQKESTADPFMYKCPFLINKRCCVYQYRGLICRTHGLAFYIDDSQNIKIPGCVDYGLNYSNVVDKNTKMISQEAFDKSGFENEPVAYNLSLKFLMNNEATEFLELDFGESKALIDWFEDDAPQAE